MKITIEPTSTAELERLIAMLQTMEVKNFEVTNIPKPSITKGDKNIDPTALFGIWKDSPRRLEDIRSQAWKRKG